MSTSFKAENDQIETQRLYSLLKEYTSKVEQAGTSLRKLSSDIQMANCPEAILTQKNREYVLRANAFRNLRTVVQDLIRYTSQTIEHGGIDELDRIELKTRLTELESAIHETQTIANEYRP